MAQGWNGRTRMERVLAVTMASAMVAAGLAVLMSPSEADAQRRRRRSRQRAPQTPNTDAIEPATA